MVKWEYEELTNITNLVGDMNIQVKPKKFICENCNKETYTDSNKCTGCNEENTIKPIPKDIYRCYLNGVIYGAGNLDYMRELFVDYVITHKMYGKKECDFKIIKD